MWFKNLRIYRFTEAFTHSPEALHEALEKHAFQPCGSLDPMKYGWSLPLGHQGQQYVHAANGYIMICAKRQEKVLPAAVIKESLEEKVLEISQEEGRHVSRGERDNLKDEIIFSLLPKALAKSSLDFAYIDTNSQLFVANCSSAKRAEEMLSALREALGSVKVIPFTPLLPPRETMTDWVRNGTPPQDFMLGEECELESLKEGRIIRCKRQDLTAHEITQHIESGLQVKKLAVVWKDAIECIIDDQLSIKRIKYDDAILEKADDYNADTKAETFDIEFSIMTIELRAFLKALSEAFGGIETETSAF